MLFRGQTLGKYRILSTLGSGGFGTVYLASDTWIDKKVALKVPHRQALDFGELVREPRLLASLSHPNIVAIITAERHDGVFFIVMEYVAGTTLEQAIATTGGLDVSRAIDLACQICNATEHAHRQGVLHRDLRPANVLVTDADVAKVADFGTSRFLEIAAHGTTVIGSPPYMAPEQFDGRAVFASDVYSIGVTLYQMVTGELPYEAPAPGDLGPLRRGELVTSPRLKVPGLPRRLCDIVMNAMQPDLRERYGSVSDLLEDLVDLGSSLRRPAEFADSIDEGRRLSPRALEAERQGVRERLRAQSAPASRFCWHCRKPLHARTSKCPFCGESQ
jgi:serine/threonine-protein kinase